MLLIYLDEQALDETEREQCYRESAQLAQQLHAAGQCVGAAPLHPTPTATSARCARATRASTGSFSSASPPPGSTAGRSARRGWRLRRTGASSTPPNRPSVRAFDPASAAVPNSGPGAR